MKQFFIPVIVGLLLLAGCGGEDVLPTETAVAQLPTTAPTAHLPTATATTLPPTSTPTIDLFASTPEKSPTPIPPSVITPTRVPTLTPEPTSTAVVFDPSLPLPTGHIYFLWYTGPPHNQYADPEQDLYQAQVQVDNGLINWQVQPILQELIGTPELVLSTDMTQFALTKVDDTNGDGYVSVDGRGHDSYNIYTYSLSNSTFEQLTTGDPNIA